MSTCTACEHYPHRCNLHFICNVCHERKLICIALVGGFEAEEMICSSCHLFRETGLKLREVRTRRHRKTP